MKKARRTEAEREELLNSTFSGEMLDKAFQKMGYEGARMADKQVVAMMGGTVRVAAEYIWDHWMGEQGGKRALTKIENALIDIAVEVRRGV